MDLRLTDYDLDLTNGELSWVTGAAAIAQDIQMRLRTWLGESVYDRNAGVPYQQIIFEKGTPRFSIEQILRNQITSTPGVISIQTFDFSVDPETRLFSAVSKVMTIDGEIDFSFVLGD